MCSSQTKGDRINGNHCGSWYRRRDWLIDRLIDNESRRRWIVTWAAFARVYFLLGPGSNWLVRICCLRTAVLNLAATDHIWQPGTNIYRNVTCFVLLIYKRCCPLMTLRIPITCWWLMEALQYEHCSYHPSSSVFSPDGGTCASSKAGRPATNKQQHENTMKRTWIWAVDGKEIRWKTYCCTRERMMTYSIKCTCCCSWWKMSRFNRQTDSWLTGSSVD